MIRVVQRTGASWASR